MIWIGIESQTVGEALACKQGLNSSTESHGEYDDPSAINLFLLHFGG